ncbi:hypothetical protein [Sulfitobacter sp. S190]|uniref:hypothetical protein n=1 Tax=Sulfitobacter sp. S190 TaxID=2867022 RepID=UPI0021A3D595|nr:hypothetical protein [Sulfitobacter sp. S190]UWR20851.1 hypothetical protein K3756_08895 [Sulfitobacter sp. S190]
MLDIRHLLRMKRWSQSPPSARRVKLVFGVVAVALLIIGLEKLGLWPQWATAERLNRRF